MPARRIARACGRRWCHCRMRRRRAGHPARERRTAVAVRQAAGRDVSSVEVARYRQVEGRRYVARRPGRRLDLAAVALGRPSVEQADRRRVGRPGPRARSRRATRSPARDSAGANLRLVRLSGVARASPGLDAAVEHRDSATVAEVVEHPPQPRRDRPADVVVRDHVVVRADARPPRAARAKACGVGSGWRPGRAEPSGSARSVVEVEEDRPRDVARLDTRHRPSPGRPRYQRTSTTRIAGSAKRSASCATETSATGGVWARLARPMDTPALPPPALPAIHVLDEGPRCARSTARRPTPTGPWSC